MLESERQSETNVVTNDKLARYSVTHLRYASIFNNHLL